MPVDAAIILRHEVCPRCEYSLAAHPPEGVCPECGYAYDAGTICLYSYAEGRTARTWNRRPRSWGAMAAEVFCIVVFFAVFTSGTSLQTKLLVWGIGAFIIIGEYWGRRADTGTGLVQVRLGLAGFRQVNRHLGPMPFERGVNTRLIPWRKADEIDIVQLNPHEARIQIKRRDVWWRFPTHYVDASVKCSDVQRVLLAGQIQRWRRDGHS